MWLFLPIESTRRRFMRSSTVAMAILITFGTRFQEQSPMLPAGLAPERVSPNDNRVSAGTLRGGILTVRLEMRAEGFSSRHVARPG